LKQCRFITPRIDGDQGRRPRRVQDAGASKEEHAMMRNVGRIDQYARIIIGLALLAYTVKEGSLGAGWVVAGTIGVVLIVTAFFSFCPLYTLLGVNTRQKSSSV
jgi:hypothetical protein